MLIGSREKAAGRTHRVCGRDYTFNPHPKAPQGVNACEVKEPDAQAVFLSQRNSNVFYPIPGEVTETSLQRPKQIAPAPVAPPVAPPPPDPAGQQAQTPPPADYSAAVAALQGENATDLVKTVKDNIDRGLLTALLAAENAREGGARSTVVNAINARLGALPA